MLEVKNLTFKVNENGIERSIVKDIRFQVGDVYKRQVEVGSHPEFQDLSDGINTMVNSIVRTTDRISKIIDIAEIPLAAFEYQEDMKDVFVTSRLNELLDLPKEEVERISRSPGQFLSLIHI